MKSLVLSLAIFSAIVAFGQNAPKTKLVVHVTTDRSSFTATDNIQLTITRKNVGRSRLFIYKRWEWGVSKIRVFDSKGGELEHQVYPIDDPPPLMASDFIMLNPGQQFETRLERPITDVVKNPGEYELSIEYVPYLSESSARKFIPADTPFWSKRRGTVKSNRIKIRLTGAQ